MIETIIITHRNPSKTFAKVLQDEGFEIIEDRVYKISKGYELPPIVENIREIEKITVVTAENVTIN